MCINASTTKWHTENDCSYTLVSVPKQECERKYVFYFRLNPKIYVGIPMQSGVSFISSMKLLTHRQQCIADPGIDSNFVSAQGNKFINVCSYANRRLFTHVRASLKRNMTDQK